MTTSLRLENSDELPRLSTDKSTITAAKIRDLYEKGVRDIREQILEYQLNAAYLEGQQHIYRHQYTNQIVQIPKPKRRVRATVPRLGPESRRIFSKLLKRPLVFEVTPDSPDDESIRGAAIAEGVLLDLARRQKWERLREEVALGAWKGGTAFLCLDWDSQAGRYLGSTPSGKSMGEGDVRVTALSIVEGATEVGTRDVERACFFIKAQALPPAEAKKIYNLSAEPSSDASSANSPVQTRLVRSSNGGEIPKNLCLVLTYYERPSNDNKKGTVATVIGNQIVDGPHPWPFPFTDRLNIVCVRESIVEGRWTGRTVVSDAVPIQTALNHATTSALEHLKQAGNARLQNNSIEKNNAENWTDNPGEFVFYDDQPWAWLSPPSMPDWWQRVPEWLAQAMDDAIGVHDVSRGNAPANVESGVGLSILAEQDDTPTGRISQTLADAFSDLATMVLQTYEKNVLMAETRTVRIQDEHAPIMEKFTWNGLSFAGQTVARVPYDAVAPINEAARFARGMALMDRQVIQGGPQLAAYVDVPGLNAGDWLARINPQVAKARRENYQMGQGETCIPADFDDHATHIQEHNNFRLSGRYERMDDQNKQIIDLHVQAHSTLAAEEMGQQARKLQEGAPLLAAAAQANQPPGSMLPGDRPEMNQMGPEPVSAVLGAREGGAPDETDQSELPDDPMGELPI